VNLQETKAQVEVAQLHKEGAKKEQGSGGISAGDDRWAAHNGQPYLVRQL